MRDSIQIFVIVILVILLSACSTQSRLDPIEARKTSDSLLEASVKLMRQGDKASLESAEAYLEMAHEINPTSASVADAMGCLAWRRGQIVIAERWFKEALFRDPHFDASYVNLAIVAENGGQPKRAKELLRQALAINPLNYRARNNYAGLMFDYSHSKSEDKLAYRELLKAVRAAPNTDAVLEYNLKKFKSSSNLR